jgi:RND family efflux transporter MFP subunit
VHVETATVQRISIQRQVDVSGTLISTDQTKVSSEVAGIVREILVELGQEVTAGQVLVRLEPRELELALRRAEGQLRQTEAQLGIDGVRLREPPPDEQISSIRQASANRDDALAALRRAQMLSKQGLLAEADLDTAQTRAKVTEANLQSAVETVRALKATLQDRRAAVELAQKKLADAVIRAPIAGSISERIVQTGEFIRENTPVVSLVRLNPLKVKTAVQERHAGLIRPGLPVRFGVESFPGEEFSGKVAYVSPAVDPATRTFVVEVLVDNSSRRLKPGFFAKGVVLTKLDENVPAVLENSIFTLAGESTVYVIENGKARKQIVGLGTRQGKLVEVTDGLNGAETIATTNLNQLANGVAVQLGGTARSAVTGGADGSDPRQEGKGKGGRP